MENVHNRIQTLINNSIQLHKTDYGDFVFKCPLDAFSNSCAKFLWVLPNINNVSDKRSTKRIMRISNVTERLEANFGFTFVPEPRQPYNEVEHEEVPQFVHLPVQREPGDIFVNLLEYPHRSLSPKRVKFELKLHNETDVGILSKIKLFVNRNGVLDLESEWSYSTKECSFVFNTNSSTPEEVLDFEQLTKCAFPSLILDGKECCNCTVLGIEFAPIPYRHGPCFSTYRKMYEKMEFTDFQIIVNNGETPEIIKAHKAVLAASSHYFETMFKTPLAESHISHVDNFEPIIIKEMLKYIYTGEIDLEEHALQMLKCADYYQVHELFLLCEMFIADRMTNFGWTQLFDLLHLYPNRLRVLTQEITEYYKQNLAVLVKSEEFEAASRRDHILPIFHQLFFSKLV